MGIANEKNFSSKLRSFLQTCQGEIKKTTAIGKKMLSATKTTTQLHHAYEELGQLASEAMKKGELEWEEPRVKELLEIISDCNAHLNHFEEEVCHIKKRWNSDSDTNTDSDSEN